MNWTNYPGICAITLMLASMSFHSSAHAEKSLKPLDIPMEKLAPHASGLALVEVTEMKEVDMRPADGPLSLVVSFKILKSTGVTLETIHITKAHPGGGGPGNPPGQFLKDRPEGPVKLDTFAKGKRYWVAFATEYPDDKTPQGIVNTWPEQDAPKAFTDAIKADYYAHRPKYDRRNGLTHSWLADKEKKNWRIRMERDGKQLWELTLPGEKFGGADRYKGQWSLIHLDQWHTGLLDAERTKSNWYLFAETLTTLEKDNPYQRPAGKYRVVYILDAETGKTAGVRVSFANSADAHVVHFYEIKTGKLRREERYDFFETGGKAVGNDTEKWLRKLVRTYDPATGKQTGEETFRHASTPSGSMYLPVKK